jgi:hypothetical protein
MCILDHLLSGRLVHLTIVVLPEGDMTVDAAALHRCLVVFGSQANGALEASCKTVLKLANAYMLIRLMKKPST